MFRASTSPTSRSYQRTGVLRRAELEYRTDLARRQLSARVLYLQSDLVARRSGVDRCSDVDQQITQEAKDDQRRVIWKANDAWTNSLQAATGCEEYRTTVQPKKASACHRLYGPRPTLEARYTSDPHGWDCSDRGATGASARRRVLSPREETCPIPSTET